MLPPPHVSSRGGVWVGRGGAGSGGARVNTGAWGTAGSTGLKGGGARGGARPAPMAASTKAAWLLKRGLALSPPRAPGPCSPARLLGGRPRPRCCCCPAAPGACPSRPRAQQSPLLCPQDPPRASLRACYQHLNQTSRSFAAVIQALDGELR